MPCLLAAVLLLAPAADDTSRLLQDIRTVSKEGAGSPAARAAWEKLVARGPTALPAILQAMDSSDPVLINWLATAFDRIVEPELKAGGKNLDADALLAILKDPKRQGRARRLALEVVEKLRPGTTQKLLAVWLDDPEFRYEAVEQQFVKAQTISNDAGARAGMQKAFAATRDLQQAKRIAAQLKNLGVTVSVADHFGFLRDWHVIGPFDAKGMKGFATVYPPETKVDLAAAYDGKAGKVKWKRFHAKEPPPTAAGPHVALVNLCEPLGNAEDAVAYAYTEIRVPEAITAEFRGAGDDNLSVWVSGKKEFAFEEYRNGVRFDRHRFQVKLKAGVNTVLVKVCQAPSDPSNREPNWEFLLRVCDATGKGIKKD